MEHVVESIYKNTGEIESKIILDNQTDLARKLYNSIYFAYNDIYYNYSSKLKRLGFEFHSRSRMFRNKKVFRLYLILEDLVRDKLFSNDSVLDWYDRNEEEAQRRLEEYRNLCGKGGCYYEREYLIRIS